MINHEVHYTNRRMTIIAFLILIGFADSATALCVGPKEGGKWWNTNPQGDPISLEVKLDGCGDQVLNGVETQTSYGLKVFVKQSNGNLYQRPKVKAKFEKFANGQIMLHASVPTGGYVDRIWLRRDDINGQERLYAYIQHESLDSKPSSESTYWFSRQKSTSLQPSNSAVKHSYLSPKIGSVVTKHSSTSPQLWNLVAKHSGKCLHQHGGTYGNGDPITQWDCLNQPNVKLEKIPADNGFFFLKFAHSRKCVSLHGGAKENGTVITQWECVNQPNLKWKEQTIGDGFSFIRSAQTNKCIHQDGATKSNGDPITQWDCVNQPNVQWKFVPAP